MSSNATETPAYSNLLPELLLAFVGHTGGAFVETNAHVVSLQSLGTYSLVPEVDWVSLAERYDQAIKIEAHCHPVVTLLPLVAMYIALHPTLHSHLSPFLTSGSNSIA